MKNLNTKSIMVITIVFSSVFTMPIAVMGQENEYNNVLDRASEMLDDWHSEADGYYDERSEKWQEGDSGVMYEEWKESFNVDVEHIYVEPPDELDIPEMEHGPEIEEIADGPDE